MKFLKNVEFKRPDVKFKIKDVFADELFLLENKGMME